MPRLDAVARIGAIALLVMFAESCSNDATRTPTSSADAGAGVRMDLSSLSSSNFQQCANGKDGGLPCSWINGVLNDSKSDYREGDVIAQRMVISGLTVGHTYRLAFDWGWEKAINPGHMNYDFLAAWNSTLGALAVVCRDLPSNNDYLGVCNTDATVLASHLGADSISAVIPDAVFTTNAPLGLTTELQAAIDRFQTIRGADAVRMTVLGGSFPGNAFENATYNVSGDNVTGRFTVRFVAKRATVMLLWGGHFADGRDYRTALWDDDKNPATPEHADNLSGAAGQTGAPFQFTQQYLKDETSGDSVGIGALSNNVQGSVVQAVPKAKIAIAPTATNGIGESHTFTVTLQKDLDDGAGYIAAAGEHVTATLTPAGGAVVTLNAAASTCDDAGANTNSSGQCTLVFTSNSAGTVTGSATATLTVGGTQITVTTDAAGDNSGTAVKTFVAGSLRWLKHNGLGQLLGGAVFTVCRTHNWDSDANAGAGGYVDITDVCVDVTDNSAPDTDSDNGEFQLTGLILGKYTIVEKTPPAGYNGDPDTENADLSTTTPSVTIATAFVNSRPILTILKTPDQLGDAGYLVAAGDSAHFKIKVDNTGDGAASSTVIKDTLPNSGLNWVERTDKTECAIAVVDIDPGAPVVNRQVLTCNLGTFAAGASFTVEVSTQVPQSFTQIPPAPAGTPLQIDGNLIDDGAGNDWANVGIVCQTAGCRIDDPSGQNDGSFGQGTSEDTPVPSVVDGGIPPEKSDLLRFYVAKERFTTFDYLYLAWERVQEPNGTTNMDFEFNQSTQLSANGVTPVRTAGDFLIKYDLSKGGTTPALGLHRWVTQASAGGQTAAQACEATNKFPCWGKGQTLTTDVAGAINSVDVDDPINPDATRSLDARTFGEARINLQASGVFQAGVCLHFGSAYLKSRSSDSFTSAIKDYIAPLAISINTCQDVLIPNRAWVSASNFTPTGGSAGDGISDTGEIKVTAPTASLWRIGSPTGQHLAMSRERGEIWVMRGGNDE